MIRINLLPGEEKKKRRRAKRAPTIGAPEAGAPSFSPITIVILLVCYALVAALGYLIWNQKATDERLLQEAKDEVARYEEKISTVKSQYKEISELKRLTSNQIEILRALDPPNRLFWAEKLNMLAELVPDGIYLTRIEVDENVKEVETKESKERHREWVRGGKKGKQPKTVKKPVITHKLYLQGLARADLAEDRLRLISAFNEALKTFQWTNRRGEVRKFYEHFRGDINTSELVVTRVEGVAVTKFAFILRTKPFTG